MTTEIQNNFLSTFEMLLLIVSDNPSDGGVITRPIVSFSRKRNKYDSKSNPLISRTPFFGQF